MVQIIINIKEQERMIGSLETCMHSMHYKVYVHLAHSQDMHVDAYGVPWTLLELNLN